ncbi:hypothetical protein [Rickettsiella endosymbiont of Aleochara curtula]|uniref:hypothetical protein n=1 Tax=Rickettsiella endosymbiont of Aleochara curtula TaxID=3077936 RepID=UPI00313DEB26
MKINKLKTITTKLSMLSLFCTLSVQATTCPTLNEIQITCTKEKNYNVCSFSANSQGTIWSDTDKYTGIDLPGKITHFVDVEVKTNTPIKKGTISGKLNSCVYTTKDGLEIFLDPKINKVTIQLDGNWKKDKHKIYYCNKNIENCKFEFIS